MCALPPQTQFCDERGYEIVPVRVITVVEGKKVDSNLAKRALALNIGPDDVSIVDVSATDFEYDYLEIDSSGYIHRSRLKCFHEPLTDDMLERMHAAKSKKLAFEQLKADAQAEAKERAAKAKARRLQVSMVQVNEVATEDYTDPLLVPLGIVSPQVTCTAILDSGADVNVMSAQLYQGLHTNKLLPSTATFNSFSNQQTECMGILTTKIFIQHQEETCTFYVTNTNDCAHEVILGRSWMAKHQCSIDWAKNVISLRMNNQRLTILPDKPTNVNPHKASTITVKPKATNIPKRPRYATPNLCRGQTKRQQRWVPVKLLKAQGYYHGCQQIWIPKRPAIVPTQKPQANLTH